MPGEKKVRQPDILVCECIIRLKNLIMCWSHGTQTKKQKKAVNEKNGKVMEDDEELMDNADEEDVDVAKEEEDKEEEEYDPDHEPLADLFPPEIEDKEHTMRSSSKQGVQVDGAAEKIGGDAQILDGVKKTNDAEDKEAPEKKVLNSCNDIQQLTYYNRADGESFEIKSMDELHQAIAANKEDPTKGCPEELVWVVYKHTKKIRRSN